MLPNILYARELSIIKGRTSQPVSSALLSDDDGLRGVGLGFGA